MGLLHWWKMGRKRPLSARAIWPGERESGARLPWNRPVESLGLGPDHLAREPVMARRPTPPPSSAGMPGGASNPPPPGSSAGKSERERIVSAFMALLAEKTIEQIGFAEIAQ